MRRAGTVACPLRQRLLVLADPVGHRCVHQAGADAVDAYPVRAVIDGQAAGQLYQPALRRAVGRALPAAAHPGRGRDVHDAPVPGLDHRGQELAAGQERALEIGVEDPVPLGLGQLGDPLDAEHAGHVHEQPGRPEGGPHGRGRRPHGRGVPDVDGEARRAAGSGLATAVASGSVRSRQATSESVGGEPAAHRAADAARGSGDDCDPAAVSGHSVSATGVRGVGGRARSRDGRGEGEVAGRGVRGSLLEARAGSSRSQTGCAIGHRVRNRQPPGMRSGLGGSPRTAGASPSAAERHPRDGREQALRVRDVADWRTASRSARPR